MVMSVGSLLSDSGPGCAIAPASPLGAAPAKSLSCLLRRGRLALLGAGAALLSLAPMAQAADQVQIRYGPIGVSATLKDLQAFAADKPVSDSFNSLLGQIESYGKVPRDRLRGYLNTSIDLKVLGIDPADAVKLSYGFVGERLLKRVSEVIYPPYDRGNFYALRGALVTALMDDGKISVLEVLEDYGPSVVRLDAAGAMGMANEIRDAIGQFLPGK